LKRNGPKGEGHFSAVSWKAALDEITDRLQDTAAQFGPQAILPYSYAGTMGLVHRQAGHAFFHKLGASRLKRTICSSTALAGFAAGLGSMPSTDIESAVNSDLILIWGSNTLSTNLHAWRFFAAARRRGAAIVVIDPYRNRTAKRADRHIRLRPGTDAALALGLMHVLIAENLLDEDFIARNTTGFSALRRRVQAHPPRRAAEICRVPEEEIRRLAREYGHARAPYIRPGYGMARQSRGAMAVRTIALLPALVGAFGRLGGGITLSTSMTGHLRMEAWERPDLAPDGTRWINMVRLGDALNKVQDPPVKALYVYLSNPAVVAPQSREVLRGLAREDIFTVVHEQFLTETALYADIVLPGTTFLEHTDLYCCYGHYYIQMARPVIPPPAEVRSPLTVFQELARRCGFTEECFKLGEEEVIRCILPEKSPPFEDITFDRLAHGRPLRLNVPANPFADGFATPSGKVEFYSSAWAAEGLDPLPDGTPSIDEEGVGRYPLQLITPPRRDFLNSTFNEIAELQKRAGPPTILLNPQDAGSRGIKAGDLTRVFNGRGECRLYADISRDTAPGVAVAEGLYWPEYMPGGKGVNQITSQRLADLGESCAFHCNLVEVEKPGVTDS
jgi:anaerobic selenocysteine-containing dehydrogenase